MDVNNKINDIADNFETRWKSMANDTHATFSFTANQMFIDVQRRAILDWLSPPDHASVQDYASAKREPDTGTWFVDGNMFETWMYQKGSRLWLHGFGTSSS